MVIIVTIKYNAPDEATDWILESNFQSRSVMRGTKLNACIAHIPLYISAV